MSGLLIDLEDLIYACALQDRVRDEVFIYAFFLVEFDIEFFELFFLFLQFLQLLLPLQFLLILVERTFDENSCGTLQDNVEHVSLLPLHENGLIFRKVQDAHSLEALEQGVRPGVFLEFLEKLDFSEGVR